MSAFASALTSAIAALKSGGADEAAPAAARVMRLLSEDLRADLRAGDCVLVREGDRHAWRHPEGFEVTIAAHGSLGFAATVHHPLGDLQGGFAFFDEADNDRLRALLR